MPQHRIDSRFRLYAPKPSDDSTAQPLCVELAGFQREGNHILLTPLCHDAAELDEWIDHLVIQLNSVRQKAKDYSGEPIEP